ncbi:methyltransferase domain-containing protein [Phenylobacterium sp.]|uniref:class I SAM-dependent methyltransferase n=1 Tax=Phenylobacterium sp. TaxID=1871053 RepID=UPI003982E0C0
MTISTSACAVCGGNDWLELPPPHSDRSVRSDGAVLGHPMRKAQCSACALVQAMSLADTEALTILYTDEYDLYNSRPSSEQFVTGRYTALAQAIASSIAPYRPSRVLEVGCGNGSALKAVQSLWPDAFCIGVEPVVTAVKAAQAAGINVHQGMIGGVLPPAIARETYDVIYSIHVIEHTEDPAAFLRGLKALLSPHGRLIITCPNARAPNLEIVRSDHQYSMTPYHLGALTRKAGLIPLRSTLCPGGGEDLDYEHNQLLVACLPDKSDHVAAQMPLPGYLQEANRLQLLGARCKYFHDFSTLDATLQARLDGHKRLVCFGTGGWASILAGYAPGVWERVQACVIDGGSDGAFFGKRILAYDALKEMNPDGVIVGVNPATQPMIAQRLEQAGYPTIRWDDLIAM